LPVWVRINLVTQFLDMVILTFFHHQQSVKWFGSYTSTTLLFRTATPILPEAPRRCHTGDMQDDLLQRYSVSTSGAPQRFWRSKTEYKGMLKCMKSSWECYKIMPLSW
jgi:hypothetical protein